MRLSVRASLHRGYAALGLCACQLQEGLGLLFDGGDAPEDCHASEDLHRREVTCCLESSTALLDSATRQWVEELSALPNINTGALHLPVRLTLERVAERAVRTDRQPPIPPPKGRQVTNEWDGGDGYL